VSTESRPFVPDCERQTAWRAAPLHRNAVGIGAPQRDSRFIEEQSQLVPCTMKCRVEEVSAHCATDDFGVPQVNGAWQGDGGGGRQTSGCAYQRADVPRVLDRVEDEDSGGVGCTEMVEGPCRRLSDRENSLRSLSLAGALELPFGHVGDFDAAGDQGFTQCCSARVCGDVGRREGADGAKRRARELLDGTHSFDDEQRVAITCLTTAEVAC
jgi:hypothetical protein